MEHKNKSFSRIKRHQSDKVLRYSIRKYSFGAASVAVAALMFLGTHAVSADAVDAKNQPTIGAPNPNEEKSPLIEPAPTSKNEETKETEKVEVAKETEEREKPSENKEVVEANSLNNGTSTSTIIATKDASADKVTEKQRLDKSQLQANITKVQELLAKVNKEKAPASTLAAIQADLEIANSVLNNNSLELTQAEVDAAAKKLSEKLFVLSSMPKVDAPKKVVKEGKNTIANTGARDSRNNQRMGEGVNFRADGVNVEGALYNVKEYISEDKFTGGGTVTGARARTIDKTFMTAKYSTEGNKKFITYDVYFQNDGKALSGYNGNAFWFYPPRDLLYQGGSYPVGVVSDLYYERYQKNTGSTGTLSHNSNNFTRVGDRYTVPLERLANNGYQDSNSQNLWGAAGGLFQMSGGPTSVNSSQLQQMLKGLKDNPELNRIVRQDNGQLPRASYSHLLTVGSHQDYAYKFHIKVRLRDDVTAEQAQKAGTIAVTAKEGKAFNALQAYIYSATGTRLETKPDAQIDPIQGLTVTKTVGDTLGDPNDPANSGYVRHKEGKPFPGGMTWSWQGDVKPTSTAKAGVFKYKVIARYQDGTTSEDKGSGSDGTVTLIVRPTAPTITTAPQYSGTLVSTDRVISGTGAAGATIKVTLQDGSTGTTTVNNQGKWTYTLKTNEKLTQNTKQDATIKADNAISVTQTQNGAESEASTVNVQLAKAISIDTPVQAGREITVKAAHDTGRFYVQVYNKNTDRQAAYEYSVKQENGRWVLESGSDKSDLIVADGDNVSEKKFTLRIKDANKKTNFPFKLTANSVVKVRSHHINNRNNPADPANDGGWITASPATNTPPTITVKAPNIHNYTADGSLTMAGLKNLVTVADAEDDADKTVGNRVGDNFNLTIKKGNQVVNLANNEYLKKGDYTLTYTTTDAAGATVTKEHTITVNYAAVAKPTINLIKGETLTEAEKRSLLQLQDGTNKIDVPSDARVEVALDTSSASNGKTATATVVFADNTRTAPVNINYKVYNNFETVTKVYDFAGEGRNDNLLSYYLNPGDLPPGMSWVIKKANETEFKDANTKLIDMLKGDGVGSTAYNFGAKYQKGRFTDSPSEAEKLSYTPTFTHEVFDVIANNDPRTQKNRVEVNNGEKLSATQAASAVVKTPTSQALPAGTTYEWVKSATDTTALTDTEKNVTEFGEITRYVKVTLPKVSETGPNANRVQPYKIIPVTLKVNETVKPTVQMDGRRLTTNAEDNKFVIFRGATFNPTFTVNDNSGKISTMEVSGLPSGTNFVKNTETANGDVQLSGNVTATANATLGTNNVGSVKVTDARGNTETYKFKYVVVDVEVKNTPETVNKGTKLYVPNNTRESKDSHNYVKVVATPNTDGSDVYYPGGMNFKWSKNNAEITNETVFNTPGTITYNAVVKFPNAKSNKNNVDIDGDGRNENVTIYAPDKVERTVTFKVKPTAPTITPQTNGDVTITPANETNVNTLNFTYIHPNGSTQDITATRNGNIWSLSSNTPPDGVTINENTGVVTIKDRAIKDEQAVTAKSVSADSVQADRVESDITNGTSPVGDTERPKFVFQPDANPNTGEKVVEGGKQIVYVTPTESTDITVGNVTDNSGKLLEVRISDSNNRDFNLGLGSGVTNNEVIRANNTEHDAPRPVTITGTVSKLNGSTRWNNGDVLTRYVQAQDAATNGIDTQGNSNQVTFKILTQAEKYTPTVGTQLLNKDVTANGAKVTPDEFTAIKNAITFTAERGTLKISNAANNRTTGLDIAMKNEGTIKHDTAGYYVEATVTYPDGTSEVVRVNVDKSDKEAPKVKLHGVELKENSAENPKFIVFRGAKFDPTFEVTDNANPITSLNATGLPTGTFTKTESMISGARVQITENNIVPTGDALTLGEHEGSVTVKDASNNEKTYNFKYIVADVEVKNTPETVALGTKLVDAANSSNGKDAHNYVKAVVESNSEGNDKYYPTSMSFKWSKDGANVVNTTTFNTPGIVKYKAVADFFNGGGTYTKTVDGVGNNIKIYAPNKIEREVTFKVQPTAPTVKPKDNGDVEVTNENQQNVDKIKVTYTKQEGATPVEVTYTATKKATGWELEAGAPLTIDSTTGTIKISDAEVRDKTSVKTKAITTDDVESTEANGTATGNAPTASTPNQEVSHNGTPDAGASVDKTGLPSGTTYEWETPVNTTTPGDKPGVVVVTYPDGTKDKVNVTVKVKEQKDEYDPQPSTPNQEVSHNGTPDAGASVDKTGLPSGTTYEWETPVNTTTPGDKPGVVVVTYPDGTKDKVNVTVKVKEQKDEYDPQPSTPNQEVSHNGTPDAGASVDKTGLPSGTTYEWETPVNTTTPGDKPGVVVVTYPDGTKDKVNVTVKVKEQKDEYDPQPSTPNQEVSHNGTPDAGASVDKTGLPSGTTYEWETPVNTTTPGDKPGVVVVTYPDGTKDKVNVTVKVKEQKDEYDPQPSTPNQEVSHNGTPDAGASVDKTGLPSGTTYEWETPVNTTTPGDKPGVVVVTYPDGTKDKVNVTVKVKEQKDEYDPQPSTPNQEVSHNGTPDAGASVDKTGLPSGTTYEWETPVNTTTPGDKPGVVVVTYPDGTKDKVNVTVKVKEQKDEYDPQPSTPNQEVSHNGTPDAGASVDKTGLPSGTTYEWETPVNTTTPGDKPGVVVVTYPDGTKDKVNVTVKVKEQKDEYDPQPSTPNQEVSHNGTPDAGASVDKTGLPSGTTYEWETPVNTTTPGDKPGVVVVTYPDGTKDKVNVTVKVKEQKDEYDPQPSTPNQEVSHNGTPDAGASVDKTGLPSGTTYEWETPVNTTTPGDKPGVVVVTYPDGTKDKVNVTVKVKEQKDEYDPQPSTPNQEVSHNGTPDAGASVDKTGLPSGTTYEWETPVNTTTPGDKPGVVVVTYPDGTKDKVNVTVKVKEQKDEYDPQPSTPNQEVSHNGTPDAGASVDKTGLPSGTTYEWETPVNTTTPGDKPGVVVVTYPDGTKDKVNVTVKVKEQKDEYDPQPSTPNQEVSHNGTPDAGASVDKTGLPSGTTYEWETPVNTTTPGDKPGVVVVTYPDGTKDKVNVTVKVKEQKDEYDPQPSTPNQEVSHNGTPDAGASVDKTGLPSGTTYEWETPVNTTTPGDKPGVVVVTYPDGTKDKVNVTVKVKEQKDEYDPQPSTPNQEVSHNGTPDAGASVDKTGLPSGTTYEWETPVNTTTPGDKPGVVVVTYPDGTKDKVNVTVKVKEQKDEYDPQPSTPNQEVSHNGTPDAGASVDKTGLPSGTTYEWETPVNTTTPGDKPGVVVVTYPDGTKDKVNVTVKVKEQKDEYDPQPSTPNQEVSHNGTPDAGASVDKTGLPSGTTYEWETPVNTTTPGDKPGVVVVTYPDGTKDKVNVTVKVKEQKDEYDPQPSTPNQEVSHNGTPDAGASVDKTGLPSGTTYEWETPVNTTTPGDKPGVVVVTYPDGTKDKVNVTVKVKEQKDEYDPQPSTPNQEVSHNGTPDAGASVDKTGLPSGTTYEWETPVNTTTPGDKPGVVVVTYPDGTKDKVNVTVKVKEQKDEYDPQPSTPNQEVSHNGTPDAGASVDKTGLPSGTTYEWETPVNTTTPGDKPGVVVVTYPDGTKDKVNVTVKVKEQKDEYDPQPSTPNQEVSHNGTPDAGASVDKTGLPSGTTYEWETPVNTTTPGDKPGVVVVTYPDGTKDKVNVTVKVKEQKDEYDPQPSTPNQEVSHNGTPDAGASVDKTGLPSGTTYEWETPVNTTTPGDKPGVVVVTYPDGTKDKVNVTVKVKEQKDEYDPQPSTPNQEVSHNGTPDAGASVDKTGLPSGTTYEWETPVNTTTPGDKPGVVVVTYPDGTKDKVNVTVKVKEQKDEYDPQPSTPNQEVSHNGTPDAGASVDKTGLPSGTTYEWETPVNTTTPGDKPGVVVVTYPDGTKDKVNVTVKVKEQKDEYDPQPSTPNQEVSHNGTPDAGASVDKTGLPSGTTYEWETPVNTTTPGDKPGVVVVTYPDGTKDKVNVTVKVKEQKDEYDPQPSTPNQEVSHNGTPDAGASVDKTGLPSGTTYEWETPVNTTTPGDKPGVVVVTYPDGTKDKVNVTVKVKEQKDEYDPQPSTPNQEVSHNGTPDAGASVDKTGLPSGTTYEWETPVNTTTPGDKPGVVVVTYPDGTKDKVNVTVKVKEQKDEYDPQPSTPNQEVSHNGTPDAGASVDKTGLPSGTTYEWETPVNTTTPGDKPGVVVVTYPDGTKDKVNVTVKVKEQKDEYDPQPSTPNQEVSHNGTPDAGASVDKTGLPSGTTYEWETPVNTTTPGDKPGVVVVTYPDGTKDKVNVTVKVKEQKDEYDPQPSTPNQEVSHNGTPDAGASVDKTGLPSGTTYEWETPVNTTTPGDKPGVVVVTYPDGTKDKVNVTVKVKEQKDEYDPQPSTPNQEVSHNGTPDAGASVDKTGLPSGTTYEWETPVNTTTPGDKPGVVVVTYPDGTKDKVNVTVKVKEQKDEYDPQPSTPNQEVSHNGTPDAGASVDKTGLPSGTTYEWETPVNTTTPGDKPGVVVVTYPDGTKDKVNVTVKVKEQKDEYDPQPSTPNQEVSHNGTPDAGASVDKTGLPSGTTYEWETPVNTTTPGDKPGVVVVTYPDGTKDKVNVTVKVKEQKDEYDPQPSTPNQEVSHNGTPDAGASVDKTGLPSGTTYEWETPVNTTTPGDKPGVVVVTYPDGTKDKVNVTVKVKDTSSNGEPEVQPETPEYTGPISSNGVDENGNLIDPPVVDIPEFNGAVNGELPDPVELPKVKLIITKWIDEQGNELKPADAKAPAVLGEANEAFEHGEIEGYVFVRTDVNKEGDVVTHVFRKVTPTKPEGNGGQHGGDNKPQSTPEAPTDNTERKPETEKPTVPDTKQPEQPTQTVDAQVAPSQNQAVLPNTGTKADRATGALGALSLLGAFGLLFAKKKKDDEEETRNN